MDPWTEMTLNPTAEETEEEERYWAQQHARDEAAEWEIGQFDADGDFSHWSLADLLDELHLVRTLTPDMIEVIEEIEGELSSRGVAA